ncbi:glycoside hydrolase family 19 protein [Agrobacterium tumefaciens]|uniref:glycoside hydrolase family 19 protein n=1 Tax=Agrobacterium tumefaciens TaxID=358 RepID=UPI0021D10258|nr:glycoside hydrolase family 19 protein [Agrobacterium tumefaciens]UXS23093.1 glycoside hydrolase family 19 protein [Agrobacterium tumefaciens]
MVSRSRYDLIPAEVKALYAGPRSTENLLSVEAGLDRYGAEAGLLLPHRLAQYLCQLAHESGGFRFDREIWGPTPAQERYDIRADLGNTPERDGDGKKYIGRTAIQITGKGNVTKFLLWCRENRLNPPDFVANPELLNTDPWEGLAPIWYWTEGNPTGRSLNALADANNIEQITKRINGGLNGYSDRLAQYTRIALALTGFRSIRDFQAEAKKARLYAGEIDGDSGPQTRAALHKWLAGMSASKVALAPVVEERETVPQSVDSQVKKKFNLFGWIGSVFSGGGLGLAGLAGMDWRAIVAIGAVALVVLLVAVLLRGQILAAIRDIRGVVEAADG